jgi:hypothetical protein
MKRSVTAYVHHEQPFAVAKAMSFISLTVDGNELRFSHICELLAVWTSSIVHNSKNYKT